MKHRNSDFRIVHKSCCNGSFKFVEPRFEAARGPPHLIDALRGDGAMEAILSKALRLEEQSVAKHEAALAGVQLRNRAELEMVRSAAQAALRVASHTEQELRDACSAAQSELHAQRAARAEMNVAANALRSELAEAEAQAQQQQEEGRAQPHDVTASAIAANAAWKVVAEKQNRALRRLARELADAKSAQTTADVALTAGAAERVAALEARVAASEAAELHARSVSERAVAALKKAALERRTGGSGGNTPRTIASGLTHARIHRELGDELSGIARGVEAIAGVIEEHARLVREASLAFQKDGVPQVLAEAVESGTVAGELVQMLRAQSRVAGALHSQLTHTRDGELVAALARARTAEECCAALSNEERAAEREIEVVRTSRAARVHAAERNAAAQHTQRIALERLVRTAQNERDSAVTRAASLQRELAAAAAAHAASETGWRLREHELAERASAAHARAVDADQLRALAQSEKSEKEHTLALAALRTDHAAALAEQREAHAKALRACSTLQTLGARRAQQHADAAASASHDEALARAQRALDEAEAETAAARVEASLCRERADERVRVSEGATAVARAATALQVQQLATTRAHLAQLLAAAVAARQRDLRAAVGAASRFAAAAARSAHGHAIDAAAAAEAPGECFKTTVTCHANPSHNLTRYP